MSKKVNYTGLIPQCPYCKKPTKRSQGGSVTTVMYFRPTYDEKGNEITTDSNITTTDWYCFECNQHFEIKGNSIEGYNYV